MCGRYALFTLSAELIEQVLGFVPIDQHGLVLPRWNIAPTQRAPVFRVDRESRRGLDALRWGLVPPWAPDLRFGVRCINARAETLAAKPAFRAAFKSRRCLVPATAFYEWTKNAAPKRPYVFRMSDGAPFLMAGLWESWTSKETGEVVETYAIVTTEANDVVRPVHDRMPAVLPPDRWEQWIDPAQNDAAVLASLLAPCAAPMEAREIDTTINDARRDAPPVEV